ncbi:MAG: hypothetical protein GYA34_17555 [Chloroflexi bacterium]|nr:hypothetical protein [Chloroflexota bacterium]
MYLDPGSGSVLLQTILAGLLGIGVIVRIIWKKITSLGTKNPIDSAETEDDNISPDEFDN